MRGSEFANDLRVCAFLEDMLKKLVVTNLCVAKWCRAWNEPKTTEFSVLSNQCQVHSRCAVGKKTPMAIPRVTDDMAFWTVVEGG